MPTRNVVITDHREELIAALVASGRYRDASEVLREGLRLVERQIAEEAARLDALRGALEDAEAAMAAGDWVAYRPGLLDEIDRQEQDAATGRTA